MCVCVRVFYIHHEKIDELDLVYVAKDFVCTNTYNYVFIISHIFNTPILYCIMAPKFAPLPTNVIELNAIYLLCKSLF